MKPHSQNATPASLGNEIVRVLVGPDQREFSVHKKLLCSASPYFSERLAATPPNLSSSATQSPQPPRFRHADSAKGSGSGAAVLWLSSESPEVFESLILWLYHRRAFSALVEEAIASVDPDTCSAAFSELSHEYSRRKLHWNLVRLHLFAAKALLPALQDAAMDAIQDLYLRCDWEVSPSFARFLYTECDAEHALRLRKWAVAMIAWTLAVHPSASSGSEWQLLLDSTPVLARDFAVHLTKMAGSRGANLCVKNPQLRLPANKLRSEERFFGFRQCSFHSHRSAVGEAPCPHYRAGADDAVDIRRTVAIPSLPSHTRTRPDVRAKDEMESDESDRSILSPISVHIRDGFYLDCS